MAATIAKFASIPIKYAPKRKVLEFAAPQWKNKLGEFSDPDVLGWINRLYQDKAFKTPEAFNKAYDEGRAMGLSPGAAVGWRNKTMILTKEDIDNLEEEFNGGGFDRSHINVQKMLMKMRAALQTGEKVLYVY